jgi:hypothetical protein
MATLTPRTKCKDKGLVYYPPTKRCRKAEKATKPAKATATECPAGKILNPKTNKCVLRTGKIGLEILAKQAVKTPAPATTTRIANLDARNAALTKREAEASRREANYAKWQQAMQIDYEQLEAFLSTCEGYKAQLNGLLLMQAEGNKRKLSAEQRARKKELEKLVKASMPSPSSMISPSSRTSTRKSPVPSPTLIEITPATKPSAKPARKRMGPKKIITKTKRDKSPPTRKKPDLRKKLALPAASPKRTARRPKRARSPRSSGPSKRPRT